MSLPFPLAPEPTPEDLETGRLMFAGQIDFLKGVVAMDGLPPADRIEVCFAGRSNVGKSSLINRLAGARGHWVPVGTPVQIADLIEQWFRSGAADGFNVMPPAFPDGFEVFLDEVLPILRQRGLFRSEYAGSTLREHYGLTRPESRYTLKTA